MANVRFLGGGRRGADGSVDPVACRELAAATAESSPTAAALEAVWIERLGPAFRSWRNLIHRWRFRRRYRWPPLRPSQVVVEVAAGRVPDCPACSALCCRSPNLVSLRLVDLARLVDAGLDWAAVPPRLEARGEIYRDHPELEELERLDSFRLFPVLAQRDGHCVFLGLDQRCAIYPLRPLACRRYPYLLAPDLRRARFSAGCRHWRDRASEGQPEDWLVLLVEHFNQKLRDLVLLELGHDELVRLGLWERLPAARQGRRFATVLAARDDANTKFP